MYCLPKWLRFWHAMMLVSVLARGLVELVTINDLDGANNLVAPLLPQGHPFSFSNRGMYILYIYIYISPKKIEKL